jgi:lysophospholipase L1-like esterase
MRAWLLRSMVFLTLILIIQLVIPRIIQRGVFPEYESLLRSLKQGADVVYLGDSTVKRYDTQDKDTRSIGTFLQERLPETSVTEVAHEAYQAKMYAGFAHTIARASPHPRAVIIPINLRTFSPLIDKNPETQFAVDEAFLRLGVPGSFYKPFKTFYQAPFHASYANIPWTQEPIILDEEYLGTVQDFLAFSSSTYSLEKERRRIALNYFLPISPTHDYLSSLDTISKTLLAKDITPLYYITPLDRERMQTFWPDTNARIAQQIDRVHTTINAEPEAHLLDLSTLLPSSGFIQELYTSEHLNERGRKAVADALAEAIRPLLQQKAP